MAKPLVSVLMPAYCAESTIRAAVDSVLGQTFANLELVVVDDGSTDTTPDILNAYQHKDARVRALERAHRGLIPTLNEGLAACCGELVARMDADDVSHPRRLELQVAAMESAPDLSVCSSLVRMFPRQGLLVGMRRYQEWLNSLRSHEQIIRDIFVESPVAHPSVMVRRAELVEMGGYQDHGWAEDYDLWLRYHEAGKRFGKLERTLLWWRQHPGRLTFADPRYSVENFLRAKAHYISRQLEGADRPVLLWGAGRIGRRLIRHLLREGLDVETVIDIDPGKIGRLLRGRPIVPREYLTTRTDAFVIAAVGSAGARELIRAYLRSLGLTETRDFVCAA